MAGTQWRNGWLACSVVLLASACAERSSEAGAVPGATREPAPLLEGQLDILAWPGYVERGARDPAYDWVSAFEKSTGCTVNAKTVGSADEMAMAMARGGVDVATASGDVSLRLIAGGHVQPIDVSRIQGYAALHPRLRDAAWHTVDGVHYGVPFQWAPNVLMYDSVAIKSVPDSWSVVFEEQQLDDGKSNRGRVQAHDNPIRIADAALFAATKRPGLGIRDPYALNEAQYAAALEVLRKQRPLVHRYWHDAEAQIDDFRDSGVVASDSSPYQVNSLRGAGQSVTSVLPAGNGTGWADSMMLHRDARHPNCAYRWMQWSLTPKVQGDVAAWYGSVPVVAAACRGNRLLGENGCRDNGAGFFDRIHFWRMPQARCGKAACVPFSRWTRDYMKIMGE